MGWAPSPPCGQPISSASAARDRTRGFPLDRTYRALYRYASVLVVIAVLASAFLAAGARASLPDDGAQPRQFTDTTLRIGALQEPDSLNPHVGVLSASYAIWAYVYELLVAIGPDLEPYPSLAYDWDRSLDNLTWTFYLVDNATWHDGVPFTAEDVNFTFRYIAAADAWNPIGCDLTMLQGYLNFVDVGNITVIDPYTIEIPTFVPKANMLSMFIQILPKHIWSGIPCNRASNVKNVPPIGTGMYKFNAWFRGNYIQLDLNTDYWRLDPTQDYVDHIIITYYQSDSLLYQAFNGGTEHATSELPAAKFRQMPLTVGGGTSPNVGKFETDSISMSEIGACVASDGVIAAEGKRGGRHWLTTNVTVRQALQHAVNRSFLVENVLLGTGDPGETLIPPASAQWHYDVPAAQEYYFSLDRARELLNDPKGDGMTLRAGQTAPGDYGQNLDPAIANNQDAFIDTTGDNVRDVVNAAEVVAGDEWGSSAPNGNDLRFTLSLLNYDTEGQDAADYEIGWWADVGIAVAKDIVSEARMITITYDCSADLYDWGWGGDVDPDFLLSVMTTDQILYWQDAWYTNTTYDDWYLLQQTQVDPAERQATVFNMQKLLYDQAVYLITWYPHTLTLVRTDLSGSARAAIYKLGSPATGAQTVTVTFGAASSAVAGAITVTGSDTSTATMISNHNGAGATSSAPSVTVTSAAGELVVDSLGVLASATALTPGAGQTERWDIPWGALRGGGSTEPGASSVTMSWTSGNAAWAISAASIRIPVSWSATVSWGTTYTGLSVDVSPANNYVSLARYYEAAADEIQYTVCKDLNTSNCDAAGEFTKWDGTPGVDSVASEAKAMSAFLDGSSVQILTTETTLGSLATTFPAGDVYVIASVQTSGIPQGGGPLVQVAPGNLKLKRGGSSVRPGRGDFFRGSGRGRRAPARRGTRPESRRRRPDRGT